jgi:hypothetical protein
MATPTMPCLREPMEGLVARMLQPQPRGTGGPEGARRLSSSAR